MIEDELPAQRPIDVEGAAVLLRKLAPEILQRWEDQVRAEVAAARRQDRLALFDEIPLFLAQLSLTLSGESDLRGEDACLEHGEQRAVEADYSIDAVILEYRLLRKTILQALTEEAPVQMEACEAINDNIELAMQRAAERFVKVQRRALEAKTEQLEAKARELELADRHKDEFVAILAHELRTPLSAVSSALYILEHIELDERVAEQTGTLRRQFSSLSRLVHDITDLTRFREGKLDLQYSAVSLGQIARNAAASVGPFIETRGHDLIVDVSSESILVDGDPTRLEQILVNLLNNAARYTEPGGTIWLTLEREDAQAVIRVKDTGIGIDATVLPQVFDLFMQASRPAARSQGNLGIGLALVKQLTQLHRGTVTAASDGDGKGSEFIVRLPLLHS